MCHYFEKGRRLTLKIQCIELSSKKISKIYCKISDSYLLRLPGNRNSLFGLLILCVTRRAVVRCTLIRTNEANY